MIWTNGLLLSRIKNVLENASSSAVTDEFEEETSERV